MTYKDNTPTFNAGNRRITNYKDFIQNEPQEEEELKDIKKSFIKNELEVGLKQHKYKYNKVTHKMDDLVEDEVDDKLEVFDENLENDNKTTEDIKNDILKWAEEIFSKTKLSAHDVFDDMNDNLEVIKTFYADECPKDQSGMVLTLHDAELLAYEYARRLLGNVDFQAIPGNISESKKSKVSKYYSKQNEAYEFDEDGIQDGVYDITGIDFLLINQRTDKAKIEEFKSKYPDGYQCENYDIGIYYLSEKPTKRIPIDNRGYPNFEGHGTLTVIDNCPKTILVIGQND